MEGDSFPAEDIPDENWTQLSQSESEYEPSQSQSLQDSEEIMSTPEPEAKESVKRVIVEKDLLLNLFTVCNHPGCGSFIDRDDVQVITKGAAVSIRTICANFHEYK